eukprot:1679885-Rhodomonas_salina.1
MSTSGMPFVRKSRAEMRSVDTGIDCMRQKSTAKIPKATPETHVTRERQNITTFRAAQNVTNTDRRPGRGALRMRMR